jgi:regulatory protein spx
VAMVTLYYTPSCASCRKAKAWLEENEIPFKERNIFSEMLTLEEIKEILRLTDFGTEEIISKRSKVFEELNLDIDKIPMKDLYQIIQEHPSILRRPIIHDSKRLQIGFNEDEIRKFLPRRVRDYYLQEYQKMIN